MRPLQKPFVLTVALCTVVPLLILPMAPANAAAKGASAIHPIINSEGLLFGGVRNGHWLDGDHIAPKLKGKRIWEIQGQDINEVLRCGCGA